MRAFAFLLLAGTAAVPAAAQETPPPEAQPAPEPAPAADATTAAAQDVPQTAPAAARDLPARHPSSWSWPHGRPA